MTNQMTRGSVVVGVDGSVGGDVALEWAVRYAAARHRRLTVVYGAGDPAVSPEWVAMVGSGPALHEGHRVTKHALDVVARLAPGVHADASTVLEDARTALLDQAVGASILVVGTRGHGPVRALLLGSVSTAVALHARCPVAVVRPSDRDGTGVVGGGTEGGLEGAVVVATAGRPASAAALDVGFDLASVERRPLHVVHTWSETGQAEGPEDHERLLAETIAGYRERHPDVTVVRHVLRADPLQTLVSMSQDASVVVVGPPGRSGVRALLGSVSREVVERAHCTVVVAHR
jgi:nucleotide-binding universal stress UspA family protein